MSYLPQKLTWKASNFKVLADTNVQTHFAVVCSVWMGGFYHLHPNSDDSQTSPCARATWGKKYTKTANSFNWQPEDILWYWSAI